MFVVNASATTTSIGIVNAKHVGLVLNGLVEKGYIARVDDTHFAYEQDDEDTI